VVFLLHGIRTQGEWAQRTASVLEIDPSIRARPIRYEFFDALRFLLPLAAARERPIRRITGLLRDELSRQPQYVSVIAHSFGTFILARILDREPDIRFHRVVLAGSIVSDDFDWSRYGHRLDPDIDGDWQALNDCGMQNMWPVLAKSITWGYGASGRFGFGHVRVKDRFFNVGHSGFFQRDFAKTYWAPYLSDGRIVEGILERPTNPWWVSLLTVIKLRYLLILLILFGAASGVHLIPRLFGDHSSVRPVPIMTGQLSIDDSQKLVQIRSGKHVKVSLESFFPLAVLSGQITESELDAFLARSASMLKEPTNYYGTGDQDAIAIASGWEIFIWRTNNPSVFGSTQEGVLAVCEYLAALRRGNATRPPSLMGVSVTIRGTERFFDLEGIPGSGQRTWVGFDLRN
jgi:pimeloyl-ACP methyl ester carboxylesterase